jgi:hypothetical protein
LGQIELEEAGELPYAAGEVGLEDLGIEAEVQPLQSHKVRKQIIQEITRTRISAAMAGVEAERLEEVEVAERPHEEVVVSNAFNVEALQAGRR